MAGQRLIVRSPERIGDSQKYYRIVYFRRRTRSAACTIAKSTNPASPSDEWWRQFNYKTLLAAFRIPGCELPGTWGI